MYKILGIDNKEYGPVPAEIVRRWIREGRADARTRVQSVDSSVWKSLADCPEFAADLPVRRGPPPLPPSGTPAPTTPAAVPLTRVPTSGLAVASFVLAVLAPLSVGITAPIALALGIAALVRISRRRGHLKGRGLALGGVIISALALIILSAVVLVAVVEHSRPRRWAQPVTSNCPNNLYQLHQAVRKYVNDHSDHYPASTNWSDALLNYLPSTDPFRCPIAPPGHLAHFAYNVRLSGREESSVNPRTVVLFEFSGGWNVSGGPELLTGGSRHGTHHVCLADGSIQMVPDRGLAELRWDP
jgi:hypothetical protein